MEETTSATKEQAYYKKNKSKILAYAKLYREKHRLKILTKQRLAKIKNPGRPNEHTKTWRLKHPGKVNALNAFRKSKKLQATPKWADKEKINQIYHLANLQKIITGQNYHVDHIVPLNHPLVCGLHTAYNLQITTALYNIKKGNRTWPQMP